MSPEPYYFFGVGYQGAKAILGWAADESPETFLEYARLRDVAIVTSGSSFHKTRQELGLETQKILVESLDDVDSGLELCVETPEKHF